MENMLQKMLFSNCHVKFIFPMALAVAGSALGLILFCFHSFCCFMMPEKVLVFKQIILFRKVKFGSEIESGPKNSVILNWVSNLNVENNFFFQYLKTFIISSFVFSHRKKSDLVFIGLDIWYAKSPQLFSDISHLPHYKGSLLQETGSMNKTCKPYLHLTITVFSLAFTKK